MDDYLQARDAEDPDDAEQEQQQQQEKDQAAESFERGAARAGEALGAGESDQAQQAHQGVGQGQHGEVTVFSTKGHSLQQNADSEPLTRRKKVRTTHFWNR